MPEILPEDSGRRPSAAVVGAGIAGCLVASKLAQTGWDVTLIDTAPDICAGASGNPAGAFHAHVSKDDVPLSRLSRKGIDSTIASLRCLTQMGLLTENADWCLSGHFQLFDSDADEVRMREALERQAFDANDVRWVSAQDIGLALNLTASRNGLYFSKAGWVKPRRWCEAALQAVALTPAATRGSLRMSLGTRVESVALADSPASGCTLILKSAVAGGEATTAPEFTIASSGTSVLQVDRVVIAASLNSLDLQALPRVKASGVKGQVSLLDTSHTLSAVVSGAAYMIQAQNQHLLIGATFERTALDTEVTQQGHEWNLERVAKAFPHHPVGHVIGGRSAIRCMWPDRLPAIGPAVDEKGHREDRVWFATGYGSRGLTWAALAADLISDWCSDRQPALDQDLVAAVLPGRFFSRGSNSKLTLPSLPKTR